MNKLDKNPYFEFNKEKDMVKLKVQPSAVDAEEAILGSILLNNTLLPTVEAWIRHDDAFYSSANKKIWKCMKKLYRQSEPIDIILLSAQLKDDFDNQLNAYYLSGLPDLVAAPSGVEHWCRIVWQRYLQREAVKSAHKLYDTSLDDSMDVTEILHEHERTIEELKAITPAQKTETSDIIDYTVTALKSETNIINFGIEQLDESAGGMTRQEVTVVGGRPGHGKTTLVLNIARRLIEQGYKVCMFNREMSNIEMFKKIIVMEHEELSYARIRKSTDLNGELATIELSLDKMKEKYKNLIMYDDIRTLAEAMKELGKEKPDVVIDDYIQLIRLDKVKSDRRFELEEIMLDYKWLCKKLNCAAILVSQLNREIERRLDGKPKLSDFAESGVIEQTAESAFFVYYAYAVNDEDEDPYETEIICQKSRYGQLGSYVMGFNGDKCRMYFSRAEAVKVAAKHLKAATS